MTLGTSFLLRKYFVDNRIQDFLSLTSGNKSCETAYCQILKFDLKNSSGLFISSQLFESIGMIDHDPERMPIFGSFFSFESSTKGLRSSRDVTDAR